MSRRPIRSSQTHVPPLDARAIAESPREDCGRVILTAIGESVVVGPEGSPATTHQASRSMFADDSVTHATSCLGTPASARNATALTLDLEDRSPFMRGEKVEVRFETVHGTWGGRGTVTRTVRASKVTTGRKVKKTPPQLILVLDGLLTPRSTRKQFRMRLPATPRITATLWPMAEPAATLDAGRDRPFLPKPIEPLAIRGRAIEVGGGGAAVLMAREPLEWTEWFDRCLLSLSHPGRADRPAVTTTVRIASRSEQRDGEDRVGLEFEVARNAQAAQHAFIYVEMLKLIESLQRRPAAA